MFSFFKKPKETRAELASRIYLEGFIKVLAKYLMSKAKENNKKAQDIIKSYELVLKVMSDEKHRARHEKLLRMMATSKDPLAVEEEYQQFINEISAEIFSKMDAFLTEKQR